MDNESVFEVGDKVRVDAGGPVGVVKELHPVGLPAGMVIVAWPVKGRAYPVRRAEYACYIHRAS